MQILRAHSQSHLDNIESHGGYALGLKALGVAGLAVDQVLHGNAKNALVVCSQPGRHTGRDGIDSGMDSGIRDLCPFNYVAFAAKLASEGLGHGRISVINLGFRHCKSDLRRIAQTLTRGTAMSFIVS